MKVFRVIFLLFTISSCSNEVLINDQNKTINIDISKSLKFLDAEKLLDTTGHEIIKLEVTNNNFISHINKLSVVEDKMYILDRDNKAILVYNLEGRYLSKIASQGRAKNEYVDIEDFCVSKDRVYILDNVAMKLLVYDIIGKYIKTLDISMYWANSLFVMNDMIYLINYSSETENGQYHIFKIDTNGNFKDKSLKFKKKFRNTPNLEACSKLTDESCLCVLPVNMIYRLDSISQVAYNVNFTKKNLPEKYYEKDLRTLIEKGVMNNYVLGIDRMQESLNYIFIYFWSNYEYYTAIYDKVKEEVIVCNDILVSSMYRIGLGNYYISNNCIYEVVDTNIFKLLVTETAKKNAKSKDKYIQELKKINQELTDDSNPIIIKYKLKS